MLRERDFKVVKVLKDLNDAETLSRAADKFSPRMHNSAYFQYICPNKIHRQ